MITQEEAFYCLKQDRAAFERLVITRSSVKKKNVRAVRKIGKRRSMFVIECGNIHPGVRLGTTVHEALGFTESNGKLNIPAIEINKRRIEYWWQKTRESGQK